jgi:peptidoglycan/xylan/chitin deacetylase (PgdA/CDA1 family)
MQSPWLTWEQIKEMAQNTVSFGAHAHNHTILTNTSLENAAHEIITSKNLLSKYLGKPVDMFCYPNGSYNEDIINILKDRDFKLAVTTQTGAIKKSVNLFTLPRFMIHNDMTSTIPMFACRLSNKIPYF